LAELKAALAPLALIGGSVVWILPISQRRRDDAARRDDARRRRRVQKVGAVLELIRESSATKFPTLQGR
jgi:hypothetical protein